MTKITPTSVILRRLRTVYTLQGIEDEDEDEHEAEAEAVAVAAVMLVDVESEIKTRKMIPTMSDAASTVA